MQETEGKKDNSTKHQRAPKELFYLIYFPVPLSETSQP